MKKCQFVLILLMPLILSACGFHPRDNFLFPAELKTISLSASDEYGMLFREVKYKLKERGIKIVPISTPVTKIALGSETYSSNVSALYQTASTASYELYYSFTYTVSVNEQPPQTFKAVAFRSYIYNPLTALASSVKKAKLKSEMRTTAIDQMLRQMARLNSLIKNSEKQNKPAISQDKTPTAPLVTLN